MLTRHAQKRFSVGSISVFKFPCSLRKLSCSAAASTAGETAAGEVAARSGVDGGRCRALPRSPRCDGLERGGAHPGADGTGPRPQPRGPSAGAGHRVTHKGWTCRDPCNRPARCFPPVQASQLAEHLVGAGPFHAVYSSDLLRCRQTATAISTQLGDAAPLHFRPDLRERALGVLEGLTWSEARARRVFWVHMR